jgi:hypothetical protein
MFFPSPQTSVAERQMRYNTTNERRFFV